jgi:hypothetical protein
MDRDAEESDRRDEALQGDTGMIGSEAEEPGPGRDTSLTDPDPVAASTDQPRGTVAMSEGDPMRTRIGSHIEGAGVIGHDVAAAEEGPTQQTPPEDRPGYEPGERTGGSPVVGEPATTPTAFEREPGPAGSSVEDAGPADRSAFVDDRPLFEQEPQRADRPGGGGSLLGDEEDRLDRPGPQGEPGIDQGVYDQEADQARGQRPSQGI